MKKSFFKRAVATVAAVPLALTQCLTCSFAETTVDDSAQVTAAAGNTTYTLEKLLRIEPDKQFSEWNKSATLALNGLTTLGKATGTINTQNFIDLVSANAGKYGALAENVLGQIKNVQYRIKNNGDIVVTADVDNISDALNKDFNLSLGSAVRMLAEGSGVDEIYEIDYTTVDASGKIEIVINSSSLQKGTEVSSTFKFITSDGRELDLFGFAAYAIQTIEEYRAIAYAKIDELAAKIDTAEAKELIDKSFDLYLGRIDAALDNYKKLLNMDKSKSYDSISGLLASANYRLGLAGIQRKLPTTGAGLASNAIASKVFDIALGMINNAAAGAASLDITIDELGAFADSLTNIEAAANGGVFKLTAQFEDAEADEVKEYYNNTATEGDYVSSYKIISAEAAIGGENYADVQIERVVVTTPKTTTTTTTTTTTSGDTDTTTTTTTTTSGDTDTTTTTTTTTSGDTDKTTTTTTSSGDIDGTTTTTTSSGDIDGTTTTTTIYTTTTTPPHSITTTTTIVTDVRKEIVKTYAEVDSEYGFYFSYEESFNTAQLGEAKLVEVYEMIAVNEKGEDILDVEGNKIVVSEGSDETDITGKVDFGTATPANTFDVENLTFRYDVPLSYNGKALLDNEGNAITAEAYIGKKGDVTLDNILSPSDATYMLIAYTKINATVGAVDPNSVLFTRETMTKDPASVLDHFAAFLGDVDCNITDNWKAKKAERAIIGTDATYVLKAATLLSASFQGSEIELWEAVMGSEEA